MAEPANINDLLDGHVALDLECPDRIYLDAYVPNLQVIAASRATARAARSDDTARGSQSSSVA